MSKKVFARAPSLELDGVAEWIEEGRLYPVISDWGHKDPESCQSSGFVVQSDDGVIRYGLWRHCSHLNEQNWERIVT